MPFPYTEPSAPSAPRRPAGKFQVRRSHRSGALGSAHCTFAVTAALPPIVKTHVRALAPPLEQAPDQIASRPFVTLSVIEVFVANGAEPVAPTATLMPAGLESTLSPLRPVAVTVKVTFVLGGFTVSDAVLVTPAKAAVMVAVVAAVTAAVVAVNVALLAPAATVTLAGTVAAALLDSDTTAPPAGAALVSVTVPVEEAPPVTLLGLSATVFRLAGGGTGVTVSVAVRLTPL